MLIESSIPTDIFESYNITPALRRDLKDLGFTFRLFTRVNPRRNFSPAIEEMNQWVSEHIKEKTLNKNTLIFSNNSLIAIDFRPRPPFDWSNYPDDEELLGPILFKYRKEEKIPQIVPYGNKTGCIHLPPDSRIGLSIPEIQDLVFPLLMISLRIDVGLPRNCLVRLPYYREYREIILSENPLDVALEETEMSWINDQEVGKGTGEWCEDGFYDGKKPDKQVGNLYVGRTEGENLTVWWWNSSREDQEKISIMGHKVKDRQRLPRLGFRPVIEFPQVIDSSQR